MSLRNAPRPAFWKRFGRAIGRLFGAGGGQRAYEGASRGRRFSGWNPSNASVNSEIFQSLEMLKARARDMERNDPFAARAIEVRAGNIIGGSGITARAASGSEQLDKRTMAQWKRWTKRCSVCGTRSLMAQVLLAVRAMVRDGESLIRRRLRPVTGGPDLPMRLEVLESDMLDFWKNERRADGGKIMHGVEFRADGEIVGYWLFAEHPGNGNGLPGSMAISTSSFVPAAEIVHLFVPIRPGQVRGVPDLAPVMTKLRDLGDYDQAHRLRKKLEACIMAFITPSDELLEAAAVNNQLGPVDANGGTTPATRAVNSDGAVLEDLQPGMVVTLANGKEVTFHTPQSDPGSVDYEKFELLGVAAGFGLSYEMLTGDFSQTTYSSYKGAQIEFRRGIEAVRWFTLIPLGMDRIWEWFTEVAWMVSKLPTPTVDVEWSTSSWQSVEPLKDAQANALNAAQGFTPPADILGEAGYHAETAMRDSAKFFKLCKELDLPYPWIPKAGTAVDASADGPPPASDDEGKGAKVTPLPKRASHA